MTHHDSHVTDATPEQVRAWFEAGEILLAARSAGWGPIKYKDQLHDRASYRLWWQVLERARLTGAPIDAAVTAAFFQETP